MGALQAVAPLSAEAVRAAALRSGFDLCGFARAEPIPPGFLTEWLEAGMAADMDWMAERAADRLDVSRLLPGVKSVVALACNYYPGDGESPVARYARGRDYHATMRDGLRALRRQLKALRPGIRTYGGVDSVPVMEKVWAARAGLGYVGRNGCFISGELGSYVVLSTLVLDVELDSYAEGEAPDLCGTCTACVSACPTSAIRDAGRVDSRLCLSYQTIENRKGEVPEELRPALRGVVFGCDVCQEVCPLNRVASPGGRRFTPRAVAALGIQEIAALSRARYDALVPGTPLARAKYDGLRRNAAYALGAAKDASARRVLQGLARDPSGLVREAAQWALAQLDA